MEIFMIMAGWIILLGVCRILVPLFEYKKINKDQSYNSYILFFRDALKCKSVIMRKKLLVLSYNQYVSLGYSKFSKANLTKKKDCYCILGTNEVLFSFNK